MFQPLAGFIGWRYTRTRRDDQFISFISLISLLGTVLGVAALIVVMSVMNGFEHELRSRILALIPHGFVEARSGAVPDWPQLVDELTAHPSVLAAAPYVGGSALLGKYGYVAGAQLWGIDPALERGVSDISRHVLAGDYGRLRDDGFGIVVGDILARRLGLDLGGTVDLMLPKVTVTPMGLFPRQKRFTVVAIFQSGSTLDGSTVFINLRDAQRLFQLGDGVSGVRVAVDDLFRAGAILNEWGAGRDEFVARDWSVTQGSLFQAVKMEKRMIGLLLFVIVAIAAFNVVSILTMMVNDKRSDIAVLRTMGASPRSIMLIFLTQGAAIGLAGVVLGALIGLPVAFNVGAIATAVEQALGIHVFNPEIYFISSIPSVVVAGDVVAVCVLAWLLSLLAALYPARRAAQIEPAEALRYE